jgi:GNAT superfamily N-acetyltransferase
MREFRIVEANLRAAMRFFGEATGTGEVRQLDGSQVIYSGLNYGVFNIGMLNEPLPAAPSQLERRLAECARYFQKRTQRWSFWLCEDFVPAQRRREARWAFSALGLRQISQAPGLIAPRLSPPDRNLPEIECVPVDSRAAREAFGAITMVSFDIPMSVARDVYYPEPAWQGSYRGFLGTVNGRPVSIIAIVCAAEVLGIYSFATLPEERRRGYGEALLRAAVAYEQRRTGVERLVLQSTEAGQPLYKRLGFREVASFSVYLTQ